ncbi:MAG: phosphate signaling complex protein PhoU [Chloroflexota bacterium]
MSRQSMDMELANVKQQLVTMGQMVNRLVLHAVEDLRTGDVDSARDAYEQDLMINDKRLQIQAHAIVMIALQQPMGRDLRLLASVLMLTSELERMGDYGKEIAAIGIRLGQQWGPRCPQTLCKMAEKSTSMLTRALAAFVNDDVIAANKIYAEEDEVDHLYLDVYRQLMNTTIADARVIEGVNYLLWAAHNLERMADRVTNICERTCFVATGEFRVA